MKIATIIKADKAPVLPNSKVDAKALGISATIPEKIIMPATKDPSMGHFYVSLVKSVVRIVAGASMIYGGYYLEYWGTPFIIAGVGFVIAEALGILEEIV